MLSRWNMVAEKWPGNVPFPSRILSRNLYFWFQLCYVAPLLIFVFFLISPLEYKNYGQILHKDHNEEDGWPPGPLHRRKHQQSTLYICYIFVRGWNSYWSSTLMNAALKGWFSLQNKVETSVQLHVIWCVSVHVRGTEQELTTSVKLHTIVAFPFSRVALAFNSIYESHDYAQCWRQVLLVVCTGYTVQRNAYTRTWMVPDVVGLSLVFTEQLVLWD